MSLMTEVPWDMVGRLALAGALGAAIGLERECHGHPAGLRTHILVCLGAGLATLVSVEVGAQYAPHADPGRIASQIVAGIGFLGAGAIVREGASIRGLTTAASIWATAMLGLAVGASQRTAVLATVVAALMLVVLWWLHVLEGGLARRGKRTRDLNVRLDAAPGSIQDLVACLAERRVDLRALQVERTEGAAEQLLHLRIGLPPGLGAEPLLAALADLRSLRSASLE